MEDIIIGLFLSILTKLIKNPAHAATYRDQLEHIRDGINVVLGVIDVQSKPSVSEHQPQ